MAQLKFTVDYGPMANCGSQMLHSGSASVAMVAMAAPSVAEAPRSLRLPRASMPLKLSSAKVGRPTSQPWDPWEVHSQNLQLNQRACVMGRWMEHFPITHEEHVYV